MFVRASVVRARPIAVPVFTGDRCASNAGVVDGPISASACTNPVLPSELYSSNKLNTAPDTSSIVIFATQSTGVAVKSSAPGYVTVEAAPAVERKSAATTDGLNNFKFRKRECFIVRENSAILLRDINNLENFIISASKIYKNAHLRGSALVFSRFIRYNLRPTVAISSATTLEQLKTVFHRC